MGPRVLYLHGFASGPGSKKGVAVSQHLGARGISVTRLDLRVPSIERLRLAAMIEVTREAIGSEPGRHGAQSDPRPPASAARAESSILIGSSLGGLVAARVAEREPRVCALVLLAPAFRFGERWRSRLGEAGWDRWMSDGWHEFYDHQTGGSVRIDAEFAREAEAIDQGWPDVRVPTTILHGVRDDVVPIATSRAFAAGKHHVRLVELDDDHELIATLPRILETIDRVV